jgi:hypothetical protein
MKATDDVWENIDEIASIFGISPEKVLTWWVNVGIELYREMLHELLREWADTDAYFEMCLGDPPSLETLLGLRRLRDMEEERRGKRPLARELQDAVDEVHEELARG